MIKNRLGTTMRDGVEYTVIEVTRDNGIISTMTILSSKVKKTIDLIKVLRELNDR